MDLDDLIYPLLADSFPDYEEGEILDIIEEFKQPRGLDIIDEFEQEVWQKYLSLKRDFAGGSKAEASQRRSGGGEGAAAPVAEGSSFYLISKKYLGYYPRHEAELPKILIPSSL